MPETNIQIVLNPKDPKDAELASYGARLLKLLRSSQAQNNHYFIATLDDFLGVVYALVFSQTNVHPFEKRSGPIEIGTVIKRAEDVANGALRTLATGWPDFTSMAHYFGSQRLITED